MGPVGGGCFAPNMRTQKKAKQFKKKSEDDKVKKEKPKQPTLQNYPKIKVDMLSTSTNEPIQSCTLTGPLSFDSSLISLLELVPN